MALPIAVPDRFSFRRTVLSHGWCLLPPFRLGPAAAWLDLVVPNGRDGALAARVLEDSGGGDLQLRGAGRLGRGDRERLERAVRRVLGLDLDVSGLHAAVAGDPGLAWIAEVGAGRLLRAPTAWEDLVKLVLTTNCSWALTVKMTAALVEGWGDPAPGGRRAFPTPARLSRVPERVLRERGRLGYRAPYVRALARAAASGALDLERLDHDPRDPALIRRELLELPGVGPYVAENLLKFLGRPRGLALDSWMRGKYARLHHGGRRVSDRTIARRYARLGPFGALALWLDLTRDWFDGEAPSSAWAALT